MTQYKNLGKRLFEGSVIVISILLAFAIDAGWEIRQDAAIEAQILEAIQSDMARNVQDLERVLELEDQRVQALNEFLRFNPEEKEEDPNWMDSTPLPWLWGIGTFNPVAGSLSEENLNRINNLELRNRLSYWLGLVEDVNETSNLELELVIGLQERISGSGYQQIRTHYIDHIDYTLPSNIGTRRDIYKTVRSNMEFVESLILFDAMRSVSKRKARTIYDETVEIEQFLSEII